MRIQITGRGAGRITHELREYALEGAAEAPLDMRWVKKLRVDVDCREVWPTCRAIARLHGGRELWTLGRGPNVREAVVRAVAQLRADKSPWARLLASVSSIALTVVAVGVALAYLG